VAEQQQDDVNADRPMNILNAIVNNIQLWMQEDERGEIQQCMCAHTRTHYAAVCQINALDQLVAKLNVCVPRADSSSAIST
jgi:hypothetical protein